MFRTILFALAAVFLLFLPITAVQVFGANQPEPAVDKVVVTSSADDIQVSFEVRNAFTKEIEEGIKSGIPTTFTFFVELYRKRDFWFNEQVGALKFRHTVRYDTLKEEYEITLEENLPLQVSSRGTRVETDVKSAPVIRAKDIEQAKKIMAGGENIIVKPDSELKIGQQYTLKIKATLDSVNLPFPLNYMLFFVSFWNYETDWHVKEFTP